MQPLGHPEDIKDDEAVGHEVIIFDNIALLAAVARQNMAAMTVNIIEQRFEDWQPGTGNGFDVVFAAIAWHWIDPDVPYRKAWEILRPGGYLAFWTAAHVFPNDADPFFREVQPVYEALGEGRPQDAQQPRPPR